MNLLIIGGLLAFALVAILGAVLLGMGEQRSEQASKAAAQISPPPVPAIPAAAPANTTIDLKLADQASQPLRRTVPLSQELHLADESPMPTASTPVPVPIPVPTPAPTSVSQNDYPLPSLNGQVHLIEEELHSLQQQAWELEQRLQGLTEMLDRLQRTPSRYLDHEVADGEVYPAD